MKARPRPAGAKRPLPRAGKGPGSGATGLEALLGVAGVLVCAALIVRLGLQAARGVFATDECFHAFASTWLLAHRSLPATFPEFYSGFFYYYHPMLHVLGALWAGVLGANALHLLPVVLYAATLAVLATGALGAIPARAGRWAALLCVPSVTLAAYAVRFYVDVLVGLEFALALALLFRLRTSGRVRDALLLGAVTGVALLTKFNGLALPALMLGIALVCLVRGERRFAGRLALATGLGLLIAAPWFAREQRLYGSLLYPSGAPDMDRALYTLNHAKFSTPPAQFLARMPGVLGPWMGAGVLVALGAALARRRLTLREGVLVAALCGMASTAFVPMGADRHLIPYLVMAALTGAWAVHDLVPGRPTLALSLEAGLVALALFATITLPDYRREADLPPFLQQAFPEVAAHTPPEARILSLWTYDTYYYTGRAATWPNPWGQREHPVAMFYDTNVDSFLVHLQRSRIDFVLLPQVNRKREFDSANYPETFLRCIRTLVERDTTRLVWGSPTVVLVRVAPGLPAPAAVAPSR